MFYIVSSFLGDLGMLLHNINKGPSNIAGVFYMHFVLYVWDRGYLYIWLYYIYMSVNMAFPKPAL